MKKRHVISHLKKHPAAKTPHGLELIRALEEYNVTLEQNHEAAEMTPNTTYEEERESKGKMFGKMAKLMNNEEEKD